MLCHVFRILTQYRKHAPALYARVRMRGIGKTPIKLDKLLGYDFPSYVRSTPRETIITKIFNGISRSTALA